MVMVPAELADRCESNYRKNFNVLPARARVESFIAGEDWRISDEKTWELLKRYPEWKRDSDLGKANKGISIVLL